MNKFGNTRKVILSTDSVQDVYLTLAESKRVDISLSIESLVPYEQLLEYKNWGLMDS
jgi:hypothetical protein